MLVTDSLTCSLCPFVFFVAIASRLAIGSIEQQATEKTEVATVDHSTRCKNSLLALLPPVPLARNARLTESTDADCRGERSYVMAVRPERSRTIVYLGHQGRINARGARLGGRVVRCDRRAFGRPGSFEIP